MWRRSADAGAVVVSGVAGLLAGAFSMALGEYTSVTTANEQIDAEVRAERRAFKQHPQAEGRTRHDAEGNGADGSDCQ